MAAATIASNQIAAASPALVQQGQEEPKKCFEENTEDAPCTFKLITNGPEQAGEVLSLSMPASAKYPNAFLTVIQQLPPQTLTAIVKAPKEAHKSFVDGVRKLNRKNWTKLVNEGKADALLNKTSESTADADAAALIEEEVVRERRMWLNEQLQLLIQKRLREVNQN